MSGFLNYLDEFDKRNKKVVPLQTNIKEEVIEPKENSKVLCLNVEVRTPEGAKLVIEKIQDWVSKQHGNIPTIKKVENQQKPFKIPPKKIVKNPIVEARNHALDILDGLPDAPEENLIPVITEQNGINTMVINPNIQKPQPPQNLESVAGHASALL